YRPRPRRHSPCGCGLRESHRNRPGERHSDAHAGARGRLNQRRERPPRAASGKGTGGGYVGARSLFSLYTVSAARSRRRTCSAPTRNRRRFCSAAARLIRPLSGLWLRVQKRCEALAKRRHLGRDDEPAVALVWIAAKILVVVVLGRPKLRQRHH